MQLYLTILIRGVKTQSEFGVTYLTKRPYLMNALLFTPETAACHKFRQFSSFQRQFFLSVTSKYPTSLGAKMQDLARVTTWNLTKGPPRQNDSHATSVQKKNYMTLIGFCKLLQFQTKTLPSWGPSRTLRRSQCRDVSCSISPCAEIILLPVSSQ